MSIAAFRGDNSYDLLLLLHILVAIIGFGTVFLNGIYGAQSKSRQGPEGLAIAQANFLVSRIAEYFIYAVVVTGVLLVLISDGAWEWGDTWVWLSLLLYFVGIGISHGVLQPNVKRMISLMEQLAHMGPPPAGTGAGGPPPQVTEIEERGKRVGLASTALHLILVIILYLMIFKPGV